MRSYGHVLLASTAFSALLLTGCGDSKADIAADKAAEGVTSDGKKGETPVIRGDVNPTTGGLIAPTEKLSASDRAWLDSSKMKTYQQKYAELQAKLKEYDVAADRRELTPIVTSLMVEVETLYLELGTELFASRSKEYRDFDVQGDLTLASDANNPWKDLKRVAANIQYFRLDETEKFLAAKAPGVDQHRLTAFSLALDHALSEKRSLYQKQLDEYSDLLAQEPAVEEEADDASSVGSVVHENLYNLIYTFNAAWKQKIAAILDTANSTSGIAVVSSVLSSATESGFVLNDTSYKKTSQATESTVDNLNSTFVKIVFNALDDISNSGDMKLTDTLYPSSNFYVTQLSLKAAGVTVSDGIYQIAADLGGKYNVYTRIWDGSIFRAPTEVEARQSIATLTSDQYKALQAQLYKAFVKGLDREVEYEKTETDADSGMLVRKKLKTNFFAGLFDFLDSPTALALSAGVPVDLDTGLSVKARRAGVGSVDLTSLTANGINGQVVDLGLPVFVQLNGNVSGNKTTDKLTGSVAYRLGNTVIGAIQAYANSGAGFETESNQLETSVVMSHNLGSFFIEGQLGMVSADNVHTSTWSGLRSQLTLGLDTAYVSPFIQISHRQLDKDSAYHLNDTTAYLGLDMDIASLTADTYVLTTRLTTKVGYGEKHWKDTEKDLGATRGVTGSVAWSASLNLNSGVSFTTNLNLDTASGSNAGLNITLNR
ncbi:MAG: hypothetical protein H6492_00035 [Candidatus Paracaedibacteraceae bacterium]|nr:hypothetical protein [Candidatus Paracaedibacteraceae bacterium]